jgi:thymidylate kinase
MALMFASRAQHIHEVILPALAEGRIVLCDRFTDSTEAYQGGGRKLGSKAVLQLHEILCGNLQPDLTILLDNEVAFSVERARRRNRKHKAGVRGRSEKSRKKTRTALSRKAGHFLDASATPIWPSRPRTAARARYQCPRHAGRDACGYHGTGAEEVEDLERRS